MANSWETVELNPGNGGAKVAGESFLQESDPILMPASVLAVPASGGGFDLVGSPNVPLPVSVSSVGRQAAPGLAHGRNSSIGETAVPLSAVSLPAIHGLRLKADSFNLGPVYLGGSSVSAAEDDATCGYPLPPGGELFLEIDDANKVFAVSADPAQVVYFLVL